MNDKTKKIVHTIFLLLFLVALVIGFSFPGFFPSEDSIVKYGKFKFVRKGNMWSSYVNNKEALFNYYPSEVLDIRFDTEITNSLIGKYEIDTTSEFNDTFAQAIAESQYLLGNMLNFHFGTYLRIGMTTNNTFNWPIITCNQSSEVIPVIYFKESNETFINKDGSCIIVGAVSQVDVIRAKDRLLYGILGMTG